MVKQSKRFRGLLETTGRDGELALDKAVETLKQFANTKFDQTVEIAMRLGVDSRQADQIVRGSVVLPNGIGKSLRVIVFAKGDQAEAAKEAGADEVGDEDLAKKIKDGWLDFDVCIAAPDMMGLVGPLGRTLGPRGLMPSPRAGTVTPVYKWEPPPTALPVAAIRLGRRCSSISPGVRRRWNRLIFPSARSSNAAASIRRPRSSTTTRRPASTARRAQTDPPNPEPTIRRSQSSRDIAAMLSGRAVGVVRRSNL